jgi:2-methylcitrate dehydratase PrpD
LIEEQLSKFIVGTEFKDLPSQAVEKSKLALLDWVGVALAGSREPSTDILLSFVKEVDAKKQATILGRQETASILNASLVNGYMSHVLDFDDQLPPIHVSAPTIPAGLAISEWKGLSGKDFITAYVVGVDTEVRIYSALGGRRPRGHYARGWHLTSTMGTFGATAVAGKLLELDEGQMKHALGIAGTQAAGVREVFGTMNKALNPGKAALNGVMAALLAQKGFTSSERILDGKRGFCRAVSDVYEPENIVDNLGKDFKVLASYFKRFASCGTTHPAIAATLQLMSLHNLQADDLKEIDVRVTPAVLEVANIERPTTGLQGKFSQSFCVALAILDGDVNLTQFTNQKVSDPGVTKMMKRINVSLNPRWASPDVTGFKAEVILKTIDGHAYEARVEDIKPTFDELVRKFRQLAGTIFSPDRVKRIEEAISQTDELESMTQILSMLRA